MIRTESSYNPQAKSNKGARGLMQLMPATAKGEGFTGNEEDLHDESINIALGVGYFKSLLQRYEGDVNKALSAYNQGPGNVSKHGIEGPKGNQKKYIEKVHQQSFKGGGKVGVFDRPVSPQRVKPGRSIDESELDVIIERALGKVMGQFAAGGSVPPNNLIGQATSGFQNLSPNLTGVNQAVGNLNAFQPVQGQAQMTLDQMLQTGRPTDVAPITQANIQQGQQQFSQMIAPEINEQFGALGLTSSSARDAALAREAGNIATNIGAEGLRAGVGAQESASGRSLAALNPYMQGQGQKLSAMGQAGDLSLGGAGLGLSAQQGRASGLAGLGLGLLPTFNNIMGGGQQTSGPPQGSGPSVLNRSASTARSTGSGSPAPGLNLMGSRIGRQFARGGRVDAGDYMSDLIFGQQFNRQPTAADQFSQQAGVPGRSTGAGSASRNPAIASLERAQVSRAEMENAMMAKQLQQMQYKPTGGRPVDYMAQYVGEQKRKGGFSPLSFGGYSIDNALKQAAFSQPGMQTGSAGLSFEGVQRTPTQTTQRREEGSAQRMMQFLINQGINPRTGQRFEEGGEIPVADMSEWDDGGVLSGPKYPADRVHVMAQGGEGVLPLEVMDKLKNYQSDDPMVREIQELMGYAQGGKIDWNSAFQSATGLDYNQLVAEGAKNYPDLPVGSKHHAEGIRRLTERLSPYVGNPLAFAGGQAAGLGMEAIEYLRGDPSVLTEDLFNDLKANYLGGKEAIKSRKSKVQKKAHGGKITPNVGGAGKQVVGAAGKFWELMKSLSPYSVENVIETVPQPPGAPGTPARAKDIQPMAQEQGIQAVSVPFEQPKQKYGVSNTKFDVEFDLDEQIRTTDLQKSRQSSTLALYDQLLATASPAVAAKLGALRNNKAAAVQQLGEQLTQQQTLKAQNEMVKAQLEASEAYKQASLGLREESGNRADVRLQMELVEKALGGEIDPAVIESIAPEIVNEVLRQKGQGQGQSQGQVLSSPDSRPLPQEAGAIEKLTAGPGILSKAATPWLARSQSIDEIYGFEKGSIPGASPQEKITNAVAMQNPEGMLQLLAIYGPTNEVTPQMISQAKKFIAMYSNMPGIPAETMQAVQNLQVALAQVRG